MGGFFGSVRKSSAIFDVFIGADYHSHLGTKRGGMAAYDPEVGLQREIHNIENAPFRTKFERVLKEMKGNAAIGCISDTDPQPLLTVSRLGTYAICTIGIINNAAELVQKILAAGGGYFDAMTGGRVNANELVAALINSKDSYVDGIRYAQEQIDGTASILLLTDKGTLIAARDKVGRLPVLLGKREDGYCVSLKVSRTKNSAMRMSASSVPAKRRGFGGRRDSACSRRQENAYLRVPLVVLRLSDVELRGCERRDYAL